ncbi:MULTISPECIES: FxLD family lanthipeptide [Streptomycetaceae]|uniref:FxLD family lanthipeptide n=1 Tax=Streptomyces sp. Y1 TaxID=3238634 RepID=A0AB39TQ78_9ACTN|nr:FxLD family lanthipeptide [Streptomyces rubellomurinus]
MARQIKAETPAAPVAATDEFDLDVTIVERTDAASLEVLTDDGCGATCGACTTGFH